MAMTTETRSWTWELTNSTSSTEGGLAQPLFPGARENHTTEAAPLSAVFGEPALSGVEGAGVGNAGADGVITLRCCPILSRILAC
jgi:hypothetical protein